ncbi:MAG: cytochrome P450 [Polyangiaceae bacterium]
MPRLTGFPPAPIPGPRALPFIGVHANVIRIVADPIARLLAMRREHGDVVAAAGGSPAVVCAFGGERNREVLSNTNTFENDSDFFFKLPPDSNAKKVINGIVFQPGEVARQRRRLMMPAFQKTAMDGYSGDIVSVTRASLDRWPVGVTADVAALTRDLVERIAVLCFLGVEQQGGERTLGRLFDALSELTVHPLTLALPFQLPGTPYSKLLDVGDRMVHYFADLFEKKRSAPDLGRDALALMMAAKDEDNGRKLSDDELVGEAVTLFFAGHDTQAKTLAWTIFLLEQHPHVLADLLDELDSVLRGADPTPADIPRLPLLDRVIKESMRLLSPAPLLFMRVCQSEARLGQYTLPSGAGVLLSPFVTHREPSLYADPARFRPERWETASPTIYEYLPFGAGPRMCIGAGFATLALRLMLPMILQRFRLSLAHGARISYRFRGNILGPEHGVPMLIAPQDRRIARQTTLRGNIGTIVDLPSS